MRTTLSQKNVIVRRTLLYDVSHNSTDDEQNEFIGYIVLSVIQVICKQSKIFIIAMTYVTSTDTKIETQPEEIVTVLAF